MKTEKSQLIVGVIVLAAIWVLLVVTGNPQPHVDDLFFTGTAINLLQGGTFSNPWISEWMKPFESNLFFVQPPFHPWCLAFWLRLFGLSTLSLLVFQAFWGFVASAAMLYLLRKLSVGWWACGALQALFIVFLLSFGMRPEPPALACTLLGVIGWQSSARSGWIVGSLCSACAPVFLPFAVTLVIPLGVWWMVRTWETATEWKSAWFEVRVKLLISFCSALLVFVVMCWLIDFQTDRFFATFSKHAEMRTPQTGQRLATLWGAMSLGMEPVLRWPSLALFAFIVTVSLRQAGNPRRSALLALTAVGAFSLLGLFLYAQQVPHYLYVAVMVISASLLTRWKSDWLRTTTLVLWFGFAVWLMVPTGIAICFSRPADPMLEAREMKVLEEGLKRSESRLLLDEYSIRGVFAFRPPTNAVDWLTSRAQFDGHKSLLSEKPRLDMWMVDARKLELYVPDSGVKAERVSLFGRRFSTILRRSGEVHFYP